MIVAWHHFLKKHSIRDASNDATHLTWTSSAESQGRNIVAALFQFYRFACILELVIKRRRQIADPETARRHCCSALSLKVVVEVTLRCIEAKCPASDPPKVARRGLLRFLKKMMASK